MEDTAAERAASAVVAGVPKTNPASTSAVADPANAVKSPRGPTDVRVCVASDRVNVVLISNGVRLLDDNNYYGAWML